MRTALALRCAPCTALVVLALLVGTSVARAHPLAFGVLEVREREGGDVEVSFRFSGTEASTSGARVEMPARCRAVSGGFEAALREGGVSRVSRFVCGPEGLRGERIAVRGLEGTGVQIAVRIEHDDGSTQRARLDDGTREVEIARGEALGIAQYVALGLEHIAGGIDHLLFVLALVLLARSHRALLATITAFTVAHGITLGAAALEIVSVRAAPVEACIAASIVLLAREVARPDASSLTARRPWIVAGGLGLVHGLGFAGALADLGLPRDAIVPALVGFHAGVELGQLAFVAVVLVAIASGRTLRVPEARARAGCALAIGGVAVFMVLDRLAGLGA